RCSGMPTWKRTRHWQNLRMKPRNSCSPRMNPLHAAMLRVGWGRGTSIRAPDILPTRHESRPRPQAPRRLRAADPARQADRRPAAALADLVGALDRVARLAAALGGGDIRDGHGPDALSRLRTERLGRS